MPSLGRLGLVPCSIEQRVLDTNEGKQQSLAATDV
jgi:hypothetical protein